MSEAARKRRRSKRDVSRGQTRADARAFKAREKERRRYRAVAAIRLRHWQETVNPIIEACKGTEHEEFVYVALIEHAPEDIKMYLKQMKSGELSAM